MFSDIHKAFIVAAYRVNSTDKMPQTPREFPPKLSHILPCPTSSTQRELLFSLLIDLLANKGTEAGGFMEPNDANDPAGYYREGA